MACTRLTTGVPKGEIRNFTMLVGIYLSDVPNPYAGNFTVWPATHRAFERYFREHGAEALLAGMPPIDLPRPRQITGAAGDIILAHYQIAHTAAPNVSPHTRYAVFFRLRHVDHPSFRPEAMTDIWPGVGRAARRCAASRRLPYYAGVNSACDAVAVQLSCLPGHITRRCGSSRVS